MLKKICALMLCLLMFVSCAMAEEGFEAPDFIMDKSIDNFYDFTKDSFKVEDYQFHPFDFEIPMAI